MKKRPMAAVVFLTLFMIGTLLGCSTVKIWSSHPAARTVGNDTWEASFSPLLKEGQKFYDRFRLRLKNKTDRPLVIDWQKSRYLQDGRENGRFVFEGVTPETIDNLPPDTVAPGTEYTKTIAPLNLIGFERIKSRASKPGESPFSAGAIPAGQHGILLVVEQDQKVLSEKLLVKITVKEM